MDVNKQALYEKLELGAGRGATLKDLDTAFKKASERSVLRAAIVP